MDDIADPVSVHALENAEQARCQLVHEALVLFLLPCLEVLQSRVGFEEHDKFFGVNLVEFCTQRSRFQRIHVVSMSVGIDISKSLPCANIRHFYLSSDRLIEFRSLFVFEAKTRINMLC